MKEVNGKKEDPREYAKKVNPDSCAKEPSLHPEHRLKVAVYTSPRGRPQRQIGTIVGWATPEHVKICFPRDRKTYTFHRNQLRIVKKTVTVNRSRAEAAAKSAIQALAISPTPPRRQAIIDAFCKALGL